ncbi:MAG: hypothetical protein HY791_12760 [Deltaproteobacteria bacterium]|nr:hypothetical protein [Deltaproteobacteria bacterium]
MSRREALTRRSLLASMAVGSTGCLVASKPGPRVFHARYPMGAIPPAGAGELFVGAATIDLTPPAGSRTWLAGFGAMRRVRAVRDPVEARCLYLENGGRRVAIVMVDVVGLLRPTVERVRRLVGNGIEVVVASTHNHSSPDTLGFWGPAILYTLPHRSGIDPSYQATLEKRLAVVVRAAVRSARPGRLHIAEGELPPGIAMNLRPPFKADPPLLVVAADDEQGQAIATLVHFACHVETLGDHNRDLSAGFPAPLRAEVEARRGGLAIYANGALGGMVTPDVAASADATERKRRDREIGETAANAALDLLASSKPLDAEPLQLSRRSVDVPVDNELYAYIERVGIVEARAHGADDASLVTEVGRLDLGSLSIALVPGEPTPAVGAELRAGLLALPGVEHASVLGLANDELGYVLKPEQISDPEFEYEVSMTPSPSIFAVLSAAMASLEPRRMRGS